MTFSSTLPPHVSILQQSAPLLDAIETYLARGTTLFTVPGHRQGVGAPARIFDVFGRDAFNADLPSLPDLDVLTSPSGPILKAEQLAAELWGADRTMFLVNGSTAGNQVALMTVCRPGARVIVAGNCHRSVLSSLVMIGAIPVFVDPCWDPELCMARGVEPAQVVAALEAHPDATAVIVTSPSYHGTTVDVAAMVAACHARDVPLIVDEAWGAHLAFHDELPLDALAAGADVVVQSTHKLLTSATQSSMVHTQGPRVRIRRDTLALLQSTSPNLLLLASLDASRQQMAMHGRQLLGDALGLARDLRDRLSDIPGVEVVQRDRIGAYGVHDMDDLRVTLLTRELRMTGFELFDLLSHEHGVEPELAGWNDVLFLVGIGAREQDVDRLVAAVRAIAMARDVSRFEPPAHLPAPCFEHDAVMTPRDAFWAPNEFIPIEESVGRVAAELVAPYPPGVPILVPGERITRDAVAYLDTVRNLRGSVLSGATHKTLSNVRVVAAGHD